MSKYSVVNFSGISYGKPESMYKGRMSYTTKHLFEMHTNGQNYWLNERIVAILQLEDKMRDIFIDSTLVEKQLRELEQHISTLYQAAESINDEVSTKNKQLQALHCEQVIGRVLRILNRPLAPTNRQQQLYIDNLNETLKLAEELSGIDQPWTLRQIGRLLMWISVAATLTSVVSFVTLFSIPVALTAAACAILLGGLGYYLNRFANARNLQESLEDVVHNVKLFPQNSDHDRLPEFDYCNVILMFEYTREIVSNKTDNITSINGISIDRFSHYIPILPHKCTTALALRVAAGDSLEELQDQLQNNQERNSIEQLLDICGLVVLEINQEIVIKSIEDLMAHGGLDPLGAENPTEALQQACQQVLVEEERAEQQEENSSMGDLLYKGWNQVSFFANSATRKFSTFFTNQTSVTDDVREDNEELYEAYQSNGHFPMS